jgi:SAM-dependent methyltransferase
MSFEWPSGFAPIPDEEWALAQLEELARKYDTVEEHGWYDNLNPSVEQILANHGAGDLLLDYSGGTGILTRRLLARKAAADMGVVIVDSSPKFLRLALEKSKDDPRVAYRLIRFIREEKRLQSLDEVVDRSIWERGVDALASTNAIHLYYQLPDTVKAWFNILKPGGVAYIQSGNIRNPEADEKTWIIDETVEHIHRAAIEIVGSDDEFQDYRQVLGDSDYMAAHDALRAKYFLPVRHVEHYRQSFVDAGFEIRSCEPHSIEARVTDWYEFLSVYHEGVLGWVGGAEKITGAAASDDDVEMRKRLIRISMDHIFEGKGAFNAVWTYFQCVRPS